METVLGDSMARLLVQKTASRKDAHWAPWWALPWGLMLVHE